VESSCERGNESSGSIKCWESTEWLHNLCSLEWHSVPQSKLVSGTHFCYRPSKSQGLVRLEGLDN
jgi:hypothetical protein